VSSNLIVVSNVQLSCLSIPPEGHSKQLCARVCDVTQGCLFRGLADQATHRRIIKNTSAIYNCLIRQLFSCTTHAPGERLPALVESASTVALGTRLHSSPNPPRPPTHAFPRPCCSHAPGHVVFARCARSAGCQQRRGRRVHLHQRGARLIPLPLSD